MPEKLSERVKHRTRHFVFHDIFTEMAERIEALEALAEAVEPEEHTCGECDLFCGHSGCRDKLTGRATFAIHLVYPDSPACEDFLTPKEACAVEPEDTDATTTRKLRSELEDDDYWNKEASVESVRTSRRYWKKRCLEAERLVGSLHRTRQSELAQAKAEIERLRRQLLQEDDRFRHIRARLTERRENWEKRCLKAEHSLAHLEITSADAEIGRLVRGMPVGTRLSYKQSAHDGTPQWYAEELIQGMWVVNRWSSDDPAEALRAIPEVGDA